MALPLDHIVIAVHDLDAAVADYRALGFQVAIGGRHPGRTSHNALVVFADGAYLEIIAWTARRPKSAGTARCATMAKGWWTSPCCPKAPPRPWPRRAGGGWIP